GKGVAADPAQAAALQTRACDAGFALGCRRLAEQVEQGLGVARDPARAASLLQKACAAGDAPSCEKAPRAEPVGGDPPQRRASPAPPAPPGPAAPPASP